jgi:activator of HSP90 ATPase
MTDKIDLDQFYTAKEAAEVLSRNSGKTISPAYVRILAGYRNWPVKKISERMQLYPKNLVDGYVVEDRGEKSGRAKQQKAATKRTGKGTATQSD